MTTNTNTGLAQSRKLLLRVLITLALMGLAAPAFAQGADAWDKGVRFEVLASLGGQAVRDNETGIVWERTPSPAGFTWILAHDHCNRLAVGNRAGWRLPTLQELTSLISIGTPTGLEPGNPFLSPPSIGQVIWSATSSANNPSNAWGMNLPGTVSVIMKPALARCWCVRFRQGTDSQ